MKKIRIRCIGLLVPLLFFVGMLAVVELSLAQSLQVRTDRWLEVRQVAGTVTYRHGQTSQRAANGNRLQAVGDAILTGRNSSAVLAIDTGVGFVNVAENTTLRVQNLQRTVRGGQITQLEVTGGQARLQVRPFTNPDSRLEIRTPGGIAGVRGTQFGVSVQPDGKTGVATLEGGVAASAQGETVLVSGGYQSLVIPGERPTPPVPLREDTRLNLLQLSARNQVAQIVGQTDPVNLVLVQDEAIALNREGQFEIRIPLPPSRRIEAKVITPLGKQQVYQVAIP